MGRRKRVDLGVTQLKPHVPQSLLRASPASNVEQLCRYVDADRASLDRDAGSFTRGLPCTTADIEHAVSSSSIDGSTKVLIMPS